jgi:hypothetical protein
MPASDSEKLTLDTSSEGLPVLGGNDPGAAPAALLPSPTGEFVVEVELAQERHARHLVDANSHDNVVPAAAPDSEGIDPQLAAVMQQYSLQAVHPAFSPGGATPAGLSDAVPPGSSALPSKESIVRLHFPANASEVEVLKALRGNHSVRKAVKVPDAAPPSAVLAQPPSAFDPLVGNAQLVIDPGSVLETQWYLHRLNIPSAWSLSQGEQTVLADIDWGCRTSHRELASGIEYMYNAFDGGSDVTQGGSVNHGTAVTSIAAAREDGLGMEGCAPEAKIWIIQADSGPGQEQSPKANHWADALEHVAARDSGGRPKVIILEVQTGLPHLGNYEQLPAVHLAVRHAIAAGCIVCVAAGNGDRDAQLTDDGERFEPTGSILVGATTYDLKGNPRASFSNFGSSVMVCAPGDPDHDVSCSAGSDSSYRNRFGGTSGAANSALTHDDVRDILVATGRAAGGDANKPIGVIVDAEAAVREAMARRNGKASNVVPISTDVQVVPKNGTHATDTLLGHDQGWELAAKAVQAVAQITPGKQGELTIAKGADGTQLLASRKALLKALEKAADHVKSKLADAPAQDYLVTTPADVDQACHAAVVRDRLATATRRLRHMGRTTANGQPVAPFVFTLAAVAQVLPVALSAITQAGKLLRADRTMSLFQAGDESLRIFCRMLEAICNPRTVRRLENGPLLHADATNLLERLEALEAALGRVQQSASDGATPRVQSEMDNARRLLAELNPDDNPAAFWSQVLGEVNDRQMAVCGRIELHLEGQAVQTIKKRALFGDQVVQSGAVLIDYRITQADGTLVAVGAEIFDSP